MKYEGLAALIIEGQRNAEKRHDDFVKVVNSRFDGIDAHNTNQNGSIIKAMNNIARLEKESQERKLTCMTAVEALQKKAKYTAWLHWIDKHPKTTVGLVLGIILVSQIVVHVAAINGWVGELINIIKGG